MNNCEKTAKLLKLASENPELRFCESCVQFEYCQPCDGSGAGICKVDGAEVFGGSLAGECWRGCKLK